MNDYAPPIDDIAFALRHIARLDELASLDDFTASGLDALDDLLSEAARFATEVVAPTNRLGDAVGARLSADGVTTADGFSKAYQQYVETGWAAAAHDPEYGGGGLPWVVGTAIFEMVTAANMAWALCPMLTHGSIHLLLTHGDEDQKAAWLPKLISGQWTGTMNLTEPQAGSDVGSVAAKAVKQPNGSYRITGQKIFITYGDHDMAENIVHLTLARVPDAPPGTKGISCFIVPKYLLDDDGHPASRNSATAVSLEHKLGIHGSPTCVMAFDDAEGYLIGDENAGMRYMFTMMNNARLAVGVEGLGIADRAYQQALAFARDRRQGRVVGSKDAALIIQHPDVRRMLLTMRSQVEAVRRLCYLTASSTDRAQHHPDLNIAAKAQEWADFLTPIAKAWSTDVGTEVASLGLQVHGGYGYVEETGAAQHYRDARIAPIYEGTNGIQAIDLVTRKLSIRGGALVTEIVADILHTSEALATAGYATQAEGLADGARHFQSASRWLLDHRELPDDALAGATPFLRLAGLVVGGWLMGRSLLAIDGDDSEFAADLRLSTSFFLNQLLPQAGGLVPSVTAGASALSA